MITKPEKIAKIKEWLLKTQMDSEIVGETLGIKESRITPQLMLKASAKLVKLARNEEEPDDRDNLKYYNVLGIEDFIPERIEKDVGRVQRKFLQKAKAKKNLSFLNSGFFNSQVKGAIVSNHLSQLPEQVNPLELVDISSKVTKLGEGAIRDTTAAPEEARYVHPSYFGVFDPYRASESLQVGLDQRVTHNTVKTKDNKFAVVVKDNDDNKNKWVKHPDLLNSAVEIPEY